MERSSTKRKRINEWSCKKPKRKANKTKRKRYRPIKLPNELITLEHVFTLDRLILAYNRVRSGKKERSASVKYHKHYLANLHNLQKRILNGTYKMGKLSFFTVYEPKKREIVSDRFEDKIVQDVLAKYVLCPTIMPKLIYDNYGSQPGKGNLLGIERLEKFSRAFAKEMGYTGKGYCLVVDVRKFFYTIDQEICCEMISKFNIDDRLKNLLYIFVRCCKKKFNPYAEKEGQGLCIGFQTSQWMSVYYLNSLDHYVKEVLRIKYYGRYVDDFYLIHESREYLEECLIKIREFVKINLKLDLNNKTHIQPFKQGVCFLGYRVTFDINTHATITAIRNKSVRKMLKRTNKQVKYIKKKLISPDSAFASLESWKSYAMYGFTDKARNAYDKAKRMLTEATILSYGSVYFVAKEDPDKIVKRNKTTLNSSNVDLDGFYVLHAKQEMRAPNGTIIFKNRMTQYDYDICDYERAYREYPAIYMEYERQKALKHKKNKTPEQWSNASAERETFKRSMRALLCASIIEREIEKCDTIE